MEWTYTRLPHFEDIFYPKDKKELKKNIFDLLNLSKIETKRNYRYKKIYGILVPHASYIFSGIVSAYAYSHLNFQDNKNFLIIGTNHLGIGNKISTVGQGNWKTILGNIEINEEITGKMLKKGSEKIFDEKVPFENDHTIEIQLPFLQEICKLDFKIIPILLLDQSYTNVKNFANIVSDTITNKDNIFIIGTSNLGHYENEFLEKKEVLELVETIKTLDVKEFYKIISKMYGSVCGYGAIASLMEIVKSFGANQGILVKQDNNKTIETKNESVISYASMVFI